jgi:hypothetical protein
MKARWIIEAFVDRATPFAAYKKAWILPNGQFVPVTAGLHSRALFSQSKEYARRFGLDLSDIDENDPDSDQARIRAIKAGFVRINYEFNHGTITFELLKKYLHRQRDAIFDAVENNAKSIDNISVGLMLDNGRWQTQAASVFRYPSREKADHIPFVTESVKRS